MEQVKVNGVRNVDMGVTDVKASAKFYTEIWGLRQVAEASGSVYLRGTGPMHHIVALHQRPKAELLRITLTAADKPTVDALHAGLRGAGITEIGAPAAITEPGGGYGFTFRDPEGRTVRILADGEGHEDVADDQDRPRKISHMVMNSRTAPATVDFYCRLLGFRVSDQTRAMTFIRANRDHHCVAFVKSDFVTLHHIAFEVPALDSVMRGAGRLRENGFPTEWGVGRHGPGNNVFAYFVSPDGMVIEYTAEVEQVGDDYKTGGPEDWTWPPGRTDQWGIAVGPSEKMHHAERSIAFAE